MNVTSVSIKVGATTYTFPDDADATNDTLGGITVTWDGVTASGTRTAHLVGLKVDQAVTFTTDQPMERFTVLSDEADEVE